jgi:Mn-dependent DtxR family transcriptional regulator
MAQNESINIHDSTMKKIRDILTSTISCPECKHPFIDFSACLALNCCSCNFNFCGICMKKHNNLDNHDSVLYHMKKFSKEELIKYEFHSQYFITENGWLKWKEKLKRKIKKRSYN